LTLRPAREGDAGVVPPEAISQTLPRWVPSNAVESSTDYAGVIEVVIDADGSVRSTTMRESVHMQYDRQLLRSARSWKFKPATRNGEPVPYTMLIQVHLKPVVQ
jgi:protein TonB